MRRFPLSVIISGLCLYGLLGIPSSSASPNGPSGSGDFHDLISLTRDHYLSFEASGEALVEVERCCHGEATASVSVVTRSGTAQVESDFEETSKTVTFTEPVSADEVSIPLVDDGEAEALERIQVRIEDAAGGASISFPSEADVTIVDNDGPARFSMLSDTEEVFENRGPLELTVVRLGATDSAAAVEYATSDAGATASKDYNAVSGTLSFGIGERLKRVRVSTFDDEREEGAEQLNFTLTSPQGAGLAEPDTTVVTIADDEESSSDAVPPITAFHQPLDGKTYSASVARDVLIYAGDQDSGVRFVDFALQKKLHSGACSWYSRKEGSFVKGSCSAHRWIRLGGSDVAVHTLPRGILKPSVEGHRIQHYTATSRGVDVAGNLESEFERTRNLNRFEIREKRG